jgi:hypothetical protein
MGQGLLVIAAIAILTAIPAAAAPTDPVDFNREIRPILSDRCFACHGPDEKRRMAGLRLDVKDGGAFSKRGNYQIIAPGNAKSSRLFQRVSAPVAPLQATGHWGRMPPTGPPLTDREIQLIERWIDQGAKWELHWAFVAPQRKVPPQVRNQAWVHNPIDRFVMARLELEGLNPSKEADRNTLLRRVTFDLTGLPPTPAEIDSFLADKSAGAYERQIDRLLNSPRYGERMTTPWLDLARYADTHGHYVDSNRYMWHWRDWIISSFNRNMPYSEFIIEQLAGDLLPNATLDQNIATGFNRNHMITFEFGAIPEEYQNEYVVDRVETTSQTFLGLTMGCARCHDHKFDPISQRDFYRFYAFFNTIPENGLDGMTGNARPVVEIPTLKQSREMERITRELGAVAQLVPEAEIVKLQAEWERTGRETSPQPSQDGLLAHYEMNGTFADSSGHLPAGRLVRGDVTFPDGVVNKAAEFDGETRAIFTPMADFDQDHAFSIATWIRDGINGTYEMDVLNNIGDADRRQGFELALDESVNIGPLRRGSRLYFRLTHRWPDDAIEIRTRDRLLMESKDGQPPRPWYHVTVTYDGSGKAAGLKLWLNGKVADLDILKDHLRGPARNLNAIEIGNEALAGPYKGALDDLRIYDRVLNGEQIDQLAIHEPNRSTLLLSAANRTWEQSTRLRDYFMTYAVPENYRKPYLILKRLQAEQQELQKLIPSSMVMAESGQPRETVMLGRGDYRNRGEKVTPGVPAILPPLPKGAPLNRLTLAKWLVDPVNPLTARVAVNHFWQMYFGIGLVKTSENFGSQGELPSHPELLDWLATEFVRTGWNVKAMQKLIVMSSTYRQSSRVTPALLEKDPENRLLARGPRFRLPAEMIRDNALAASGLLYEKLGGMGVYPYQPKGLWEESAFGDSYSAQKYTPSHGKDLYRRSVYSFWKRTSPPPASIAFDAPNRETCTARRSVTNTPLQALILMNDPTYVEAARALAQRMILDGGPSPNRRIGIAFRLAAGRPPNTEELQILKQLAADETAEYRAHKDAAEQLLHVGESSFDSKIDQADLAAWTIVASTILNLDESITKE